MSYKSIIFGVVFYIVVSSFERRFGLRTYSLVIPLAVVVMFILEIGRRQRISRKK